MTIWPRKTWYDWCSHMLLDWNYSNVLWMIYRSSITFSDGMRNHYFSNISFQQVKLFRSGWKWASVRTLLSFSTSVYIHAMLKPLGCIFWFFFYLEFYIFALLFLSCLNLWPLRRRRVVSVCMCICTISCAHAPVCMICVYVGGDMKRFICVFVCARVRVFEG